MYLFLLYSFSGTRFTGVILNVITKRDGGVIFSVTHTGILRTTTLSSVCVHVVSHLTAIVRRQLTAAVRWLNKPKLSN